MTKMERVEDLSDINPESVDSDIECKIVGIKKLPKDIRLKNSLIALDTEAYGRPGDDPFYEKYSSNLVIAEKGNAPIGFTSLMARKVDTEGRQGAFIGKLRELLLEFGQVDLPQGEKVIFVNNVVSTAPGGGRAMFRELRKGFSPAIITLLTRSARLATAMEKGLRNEYEIHYGGYNSNFDPDFSKKPFVEFCFYVYMGFDAAFPTFRELVRPLHASFTEDEKLARFAFELQGLRGKFVYPDQEHANMQFTQLLELFEGKDNSKALTFPVIAFNIDFLEQIQNFSGPNVDMLVEMLPGCNYA
jgi:hypothetical protein